jgi:hypothetical protein
LMHDGAVSFLRLRQFAFARDTRPRQLICGALLAGIYLRPMGTLPKSSTKRLSCSSETLAPPRT